MAENRSRSQSSPADKRLPTEASLGTSDKLSVYIPHETQTAPRTESVEAE